MVMITWRDKVKNREVLEKMAVKTHKKTKWYMQDMCSDEAVGLILC